MFGKILVCSDGSDHALKAAETAAEIAARFGSKVILVNVVTLHAEPVFLGLEAAPVYWDLPESTFDEAQSAVERRTGQVFENAGIRYECVRERGHAVAQIVEVAQQQKADLIVMGSRGLGELNRLFLGSVSDGVLHHAHCPVLIVR